MLLQELMEKVERSSAESALASSEVASLRAEISALRLEQARVLQSLLGIAGAVDQLGSSGHGGSWA